MTKSSLPVGGYSVNPYVGCPHACKYCYASFMKRFTGHTEPWGTFLDVKHWKPIANPHKYDGERIVIGSVTDGYNPYEAEFRNTRRLLEELRGTQAELMICTKSDLVLRDLDLLKQFPRSRFPGRSTHWMRSFVRTWTGQSASNVACVRCSRSMRQASVPYVSCRPYSLESPM